MIKTKLSKKSEKSKSKKPKFEHLEIGVELSKKDQIEYLKSTIDQDKDRLLQVNEHYNNLAAEYYNCINIVGELFMLDGVLIPNITGEGEPKPLIQLLKELLQEKTASLEAEQLQYTKKVRQIESNQRLVKLEAYKKRVNKASDKTTVFHIQRDIFPPQPVASEMPCTSTSGIRNLKM